MSTTIAPPAHHRDVYRALERALTAEDARSFSLQDIAPLDTWAALLRGETSQYLVGGALSGALDALRTIDAIPMDAEGCSIVPPGGAITQTDMTMARQWLSDGLRGQGDLLGEQTVVTNTLAARGWLNHSVRITSLILAIYCVASESADRARAALRRAS